MLTAVNLFLKWHDWKDVSVRGIKNQQQSFSDQKELTMEEYQQLVETARSGGQEQLALMIETIGGTGIAETAQVLLPRKRDQERYGVYLQTWQSVEPQ